MITLLITMLNYTPELLAYATPLACIEMFATMLLIRGIARK